MEELLRKREDFGDISTDMQILEAERARLSLLEEKIKEVLVMLRALNSTVSKSSLNFALYKTKVMRTCFIFLIHLSSFNICQFDHYL